MPELERWRGKGPVRQNPPTGQRVARRQQERVEEEMEEEEGWTRVGRRGRSSMGRKEDQHPQGEGGRYGKGGQGGRERRGGQERRREPTKSPSTSPSPDRDEEETDPEGRSPEPRGLNRERAGGRG